MSYVDDEFTVKDSHTETINDSFDVIVVSFQMKQSEFDLIKDGLKDDLVSFMEWLEASTLD